MGLFGKKKAPPAEANFEGGVALIGRRAMIQQLQAKPELNGLVATLRSWHGADPCDVGSSNRFEVEVAGVGAFKLKLSNLKLLSDADVLGREVLVGGLKERSDLNGATGHVVRWLEERARFEVTVAGEAVLMKPANVRLPDSGRRGR